LRWRVVALFLSLGLAAICLGQAFLLSSSQWDLKIWWAMGNAFRAGRSPYIVEGGLPFIYPPIAVPLLAPLSLLPFEAAIAVWILLKLCALAGLVAIWRQFVEIRGTALEVLYFLFAFGSALTIDFVAGNPCTFEQLGLWLGLLALSRGRIFWFCAAVVATAQLKISPALMLGALLLVPKEPRWGAFAAASGAFLGLLGLQRLLAPEWFAQFITRSLTVDERGPDNPSLYGLIRDLAPDPGLSVLIWGAAVVLVAALSLRAARRGSGDVRVRVLLATVVYALIAPRFMDYSYELLLPTGLYFLRRPGLTVPVAAAIALPLPRGARLLTQAGRVLQNYYPLACALAVFALLLDEVGAPLTDTR